MLYKLESTRPSLWFLLILSALCILATDYALKAEPLIMKIFLGIGAFFASLGAVYLIYLLISGKTLTSVETLDDSLSLTYHNGNTEIISYKDIGTVMIIPSPTMVIRKYWLLNFFYLRGKHKSLKFWDEKTVRKIANDMQNLGGRKKVDLEL